ncbi:hypothetical protein EE612_016756 [Oryza sativa]|nr:hypothetical protein EE612_016756 [Oryza sativa]
MCPSATLRWWWRSLPAAASATVKLSLYVRWRYMSPVVRSSRAVAATSGLASTTTHSNGGGTSRSVCAILVSAAARCPAAEGVDSVVVTTTSSGCGPASTAPAAACARRLRLTAAPPVACSDLTTWLLPTPPADTAADVQSDTDDGANPVKKPMTKHRLECSSAFFHSCDPDPFLPLPPAPPWSVDEPIAQETTPPTASLPPAPPPCLQ